MTTPSRTAAAWLNLCFSYATTGFVIVTTIFLVPFYLRYFSAELYGAWIASSGLVLMLSVIDPGINLVMTQRMAACHASHDHQAFINHVHLGFRINYFIAGTIFILGYILADWIPLLIRLPEKHHQDIALCFRINVAAGVIGLLQTAWFTVAHATQRTAVVGWASISGCILGVISILLALQQGFGVISLALGALVRSLTGAGIAMLCANHIKQQLFLGINPGGESLIQEYKTALGSLFFSRVMEGIGKSIEPVIIASVLGTQAAATYALSTRLITAINMLVNPISGALFPAYSHLVGSSHPEKIRRVTWELFQTSTLLLTLLLPTAVFLNESFLRVWVGSDLYAGHLLTVTAGLALAVSLRNSLTNLILSGRGDFKTSARAGSAEVLIRLPILFLLLHTIGISAAPCAAIISGIAILCRISIPSAAKHLQIPSQQVFRWFSIGLPTLLGTLTVAGLLSAIISPAASIPQLLLQGICWTLPVAGLLAIWNQQILRQLKERLPKRSAH